MKDSAPLIIAIGFVALLLMAGLGGFGSNCQQLTLDMINDMRSEHVIIHD